MDEKTKETKIPLLHSYRVHHRHQVLRDDGASTRHCLLLEFLQKQSTRPLASVEASSSSQHLVISRNQAALPDDLLFKFLILLPAESLFRLQFVCKKWFSLINCSVFVRCHAQQSDTALICQKLTLLEPGCHPLQQDARLKSYFHFLHLNNGDNHFIESNIIELDDIGLIIATVKNNTTLMLMNPATGKQTALPSGMNGDLIDESYGMAFCDEGKTYKMVHLFCDRRRQIGCEILNICTKKWRAIEEPPEILREIIRNTKPVSVLRTLYWMPKSKFCDNLVSMDMQDENFITKRLPIRSTTDALIEIGESLGFVTNCGEFNDTMQVWILMDDGETWMKHHSIGLTGDIARPVPICSTRNGRDIVLENLVSQLYVYDSDKDEVRLMHSRANDSEGWCERIGKLYISHRHTLATWDK